MYSLYNPNNGISNNNISRTQSVATLGNTNKLNMSSLNTTVLNEPQVITLQREVDSYTRKLEHEKRKLFAIGETYELVKKEHKQYKVEMNIVKEQEHKDLNNLKNKVKNLESKTEKMISISNQALSENKAIQKQIDAQRKERIKFLNIQTKLQTEIDETNKSTEEYVQRSQNCVTKTEEVQQDIIALKDGNEADKREYFEKFDQVQDQVFEEERRQKEQSRLLSKRDEGSLDSNTDTEIILKRRLKKLINNNKEKDKVIHQYQKNLMIIDDAFTAIKHGSGITDIDEICSTFIKSEEQNYSLYTYVDILSQDIDTLEDHNTHLEKQCQEQEEQNSVRKQLLQGTPYDEQQRQKYKKLIEQKQEDVEVFRNKIGEIHPQLEAILIELASTQLKPNNSEKLFEYKLGFDLSESNLEQYLSDMEEYINILIEYKNSQVTDISIINHTLLIDEIPEKVTKQNKNFNLQLDDLHQAKEFVHMMTQIQNKQNPDNTHSMHNNEKFEKLKLSEIAMDTLKQKATVPAGKPEKAK